MLKLENKAFYMKLINNFQTAEVFVTLHNLGNLRCTDLCENTSNCHAAALMQGKIYRILCLQHAAALVMTILTCC